jgi:long-chain acyl-CoA synthetase
VAVRSKTVMSHYIDDPELTAETLRDGWLYTGDLGRLDATGHLQLFGRRKNMIVTEGGKNVYPEDIESAFEGLPVKEFCVFAANYLWPQTKLGDEQLVMVLHAEPASALEGGATADRRGQPDMESLRGEISERNRRLLDFKRVGGYLVWEDDFPRTASLKIKRETLAEQIRGQLDRSAVKAL